jgi:hypothetical protein
MELHGRKSHEHAEHMTDDIGTKSSSQWHWHEVSSSRAASDALSCAGMRVFTFQSVKLLTELVIRGEKHNRQAISIEQS